MRDEQLVIVSAALAFLIMAQAALPPGPILHMRVTVTEITVFDLNIDMMRFFLRRRMNEHGIASRQRTEMSLL